MQGRGGGQDKEGKRVEELFNADQNGCHVPPFPTKVQEKGSRRRTVEEETPRAKKNCDTLKHTPKKTRKTHFSHISDWKAVQLTIFFFDIDTQKTTKKL